jgi:hypothetical protein
MVYTQGKRRPTPPSRRRYEASHPTISCRVDPELYGQLKALKEKANLSVADILKIGLVKMRTHCRRSISQRVHVGSGGSIRDCFGDCEDEVMAIAQGAEPDSPK